MHWDQRFAGEDYVFGTEPAQALVKLEPYLVSGGETLVVADGEGRNSTFLAERGYKVLATDYAENGIRKAKALAASRGVTLEHRLEDIFETDWAARQYDNVVAVFIQFVPPSALRGVLRGLRTALKPGGTLILHGYTPGQVGRGTGGPGDPAHMYTPELLREVYSDMEILVCEDYIAELSEGKGHSGVSELIDFVAKA